MRTIVLARHGESVASVAGLLSGDRTADIQLTPTGREQARRLGSLLANVPVELCATSGFRRTQQTADIALQGRDVPRIVVDDLDDLRGGTFEGQPLTKYREWFRRHGHGAVPEGGESRLDTTARFCKGLRTILSRPETDVLVVCHGLTIAYVQAATTGHDLDLSPQPPPYAFPYAFDATELELAVTRLEGWIEQRQRAWSSS